MKLWVRSETSGKYVEKSLEESRDYGLIQIIFEEDGEGFFSRTGRFGQYFHNWLDFSVMEIHGNGDISLFYAYNRTQYPYLYSFNTGCKNVRIEVFPEGLFEKKWDKGNYYSLLSPEETHLIDCPEWILEIAEEISEGVREDLLNEAEWEQQATAERDNQENVLINPSDII